ncbi:L,D-transpeptidase family protein [Enterovirga aerilata]|uniref:L,D-transpeptidase family protein n=1 Tax=Enterovirga aerilata TaxID=2730920 RepID=A0A849I480_9HYPH|nr:L,D-transpeptidase family protein [Enterovirga sp. DB1703]NNM71155.1 L,D-transpeptidase family protein [Enterovirga sp. DB1703]
MGRRREAALLVGLWLAAAAPVFATEPGPDLLGLPLPEEPARPELRGSADEPAPAILADLPPPDLPAVPPVAEAFGRPEPVRTGSLGAVAVPLPAEAQVVVTAADMVSGALEARLADGKGAWPQRLPKADREAVAAFYAARQHRPLWLAGEGWSAAGQAVIRRLGLAAEDGLDPADYVPPAMGPGAARRSPPELAEAELKLSAAAALYARDARGGRINPTRLSSLLTPKLDLPTADQVLAALAAADDPDAALEAYNPRHPGYAALRRKLAEYRVNRPATVPMVRRKPGIELTTQAIAVLHDAPVARASGVYASPRLEGDLVANMERWRWLPSELGDRYVAVNIPEYRLRLFEGERVAHETRVIVGKPESASPVFSGLMEYAVVNPSWYVPPSILKKEFLPKLAEDPGYAERQGYKVVRRGNAISIRQPPGERNALGFIKFMFPNGHAVYLHDTPNRRLFSTTRRAYSHGCIRVENPFLLADFVLGHEWSEARLKKLIGRGERTIFLPRKLPVHLTYFTLAVDEMGELRSFEDIYGHDRRVRQALGLSG